MKTLKHMLRCFLSLLLALAGGAHAAGGEVRLTLLQVNDVYQTMPVDKGKNGGIARLATLKKRIAAGSPHTLLVLGGDTLSPSVASNLFQGRQMIAVWNAGGLDLAVYGNHEFDFGPEVLEERVKESAFPWLAANVIDRRTGQPFAGARRYLVREVDGVKVGFIGLVTPGTRYSSKPGPDVEFLDPVDVARQLVAELNGQGVHTIVALTHLTMSEDKALATAVPLDLILGGHEHEVMQSMAGRTPIFKVGSDARLLARLDLNISRVDGRLASLDWALLPVIAETPDDAATAEVAAEYERQIAEALGQPAGNARVAMDARQESNRSRETNLANLITDAFRAYAKADAALLNGGSIRSNSTYGPGPLTRKDIVSVLPFENPIVKVEIAGRVLRQAIEHGLARVAEDKEDGRFPQVSGIRYRFDARKPAGARLVDIAVAGQPLDDAHVYTLAANTYILGGGDGYDMLKGLKYLVSPEDADVAAAVVMNYLGGGDIMAETDGRIVRVDN